MILLVVHIDEIPNRNSRPGPVEDCFEVIASKQHGHVDAVRTAMARPGFDKLIDAKPSRERWQMIRVSPMRVRMSPARPWTGCSPVRGRSSGGSQSGIRGRWPDAARSYLELFRGGGDIEIFESGAGLLHLARLSDVLMPRDPVGEAQTLQWLIAALNSIEMVTVPWWFLEVTGAKENGLTGWLDGRLGHMERVLIEREWLAADRFTVADLLMADVLRVAKVRAHGERRATEAYIKRITDRPAFVKAHVDQMAHFAAADRLRKARSTS